MIATTSVSISPEPHEALELLVARVLAAVVLAGHRSSTSCYLAVIAPSATITDPVTNDDSSDARNRATFAISRGSPGRPIGWNESIVA